MPHHTRRKFLTVSGAALGGLAAGTSVTAATSAERFIVDAKKNDDLSGVDVVHDLRDEVGFAVVEGDADALDANNLDYAPDTTYELDLPVDDAPVRTDGDARDEPLSAYQWDKEAIDAPAAHDRTRGEGARVAVIDSGVTAAHPDLSHAVDLDLSRDFTGDGYGAGKPVGGYHGTHVAGIVAADDRNDQGVYGVAPGADVVDCRVFSRTGNAAFGDIFAAMVYSASVGCDVANLSLGAYPISRQGLGSFYGKVLNSVTSFCRRSGTLLVVAAGNDGADLQHDGGVISLPNEAANVVSVSATGPVGFQWGDAGLRADFDTPAFYTNYGTNAIDVSAPGGNADTSAIGTGVPWHRDLVLSTDGYYDADGTLQTGYTWSAGTSMAAPNVAGVAALVASENPNYHANKVRNAVLGGATKKSDKAYHGRGFLSATGALQR